MRHAKLSARRRGGDPEAYLPLHTFVDVTRELCADSRHRFLHTTWAMRRVLLPLFGRRLDVGAPAPVATKDVLESDHVLADYAGRFLPTLGDFAGAIDRSADELEARCAEIAAPLRGDDDAMRLLRSPYAVTGRPRALLFTHNSWFLEEVLPAVLIATRGRADLPRLRGLPPARVFERMRFALWMDNGSALPPSSPERVPRRRSATSTAPVGATDPTPPTEETACLS